MTTYLSNTCLGAFIQVSYSMSTSVQLCSQELAISISDCSTSPKQKTTWHGWHLYHHHNSRLGNHGTSGQSYHTWSTHQASSLKQVFSHPCQDKDPMIDLGSLSPSGSPVRTWSRMRSSPCQSFDAWHSISLVQRWSLRWCTYPGLLIVTPLEKATRAATLGDLSQSHHKDTWNAKLEKKGG